MKVKDNFVFGAQYYRPPTPDIEDWETDLKTAKELGLNSIRFWVLWRWVHRDENTFYFEDMDKLMQIAEQNRLGVTLGLICDVIPKWVYDKYPECAMVLPDGKKIEPYALGFRQIGGFPGPCYNHTQAKIERGNFINEVVKRYKDHPALEMWDVWCEPEQCGKYRTPDIKTLVCYCDECKDKFSKWLMAKYESIYSLNKVWGRCYRDFNDIEMPVNAGVFADFIDFRNFHLDKMTEEADWRIKTVKKGDSQHPVYLHVVPNTSGVFNALTCVDDFRLAEKCDLFGATNFANPIWSIMTLSAGRNKICYNAECHIGNGTTKMHQKIINYKDMLKDLVPQIGMGIRGFLFWQFKPETCGNESPAWGMTKLNGELGSVGIAAGKFIKNLKSIETRIMQADPPKPQIAVWKGRNNEIFSFAQQGNLAHFSETLENYINAFYYNNYECCVVDDELIKNGLEGIKLLVLPYCYAMDQVLADSIDKYVQNGGTVLCEAHLGGYNIDKGRHSKIMPGCGLADKWGILEKYTTSSYHLKVNRDTSDESEFETDDAKKAAKAYGMQGGKYYSVRYKNFFVTCAERFAALESENAEILSTFNNETCILKKKIGNGYVYYIGSNLGEGATSDKEGFASMLIDILNRSSVNPTLCKTEYGIHIDKIGDELIMVHNNNKDEKTIELKGLYTSVFNDGITYENKIVMPAESADIFIVRK